MNTKNNRRRRASQEKIGKVFVELLQTREVKEITVSDICKLAEVNRSTFYANYLDVYDLADHVRKHLAEEFSATFAEENGWEGKGALRMFTHIKENQLFYQTWFKLDDGSDEQVLHYDTARAEKDFGGKLIGYHIEFFRSGLNAIIKMWLKNGCRESPEEMAELLKAEYRGRA